MIPRLINSLLAVALIGVLFALPLGEPADAGRMGDGQPAPAGMVPLAHAQGGLPAIPASWPSNLRSLQVGRASDPYEGAAAMRSRAPFGFRYQYLSAGVNTGGGWAHWNDDGHFVTYYVQDSVASNVVPVFTYYMIYQSLPGGGGEQSAVLTNLNNTSTMQAYFADLKLFFQRAGAFPNTPVVFHVEPDMWGYVQQVSGNDNATSVSAKVGATGLSELAGLPDNVAGLAQGIVRLRNHYAPNVILGYHVSVWGTGVDIGISDPPDNQVDQLGNRAGAYYNTLGANFDVAFGEFSDRDSAFKQAHYGQGQEAWWNADDFRRFARFINRFVSVSGKRMVLWQIPLGNTKMRAVNNTWDHYQDNRVEWFLDEPGRTHLTEYVNAGVIAFLFGRGAGGATSPLDSANNGAGDGVTNPSAINGNTQLSYNADDDGGFFHNRAAGYYATGAMSLPGGSGTAPTPTHTPVSTATPTPIPTATVTPTPTVDCDPRPPVTVRTTPNGSSLRVDLTATGEHNRLLSLQFTGTANALVDVGGQNGRAGAFTVSLPGAVTTMFHVRRAAPGAATVSLNVVDRCGSWQTFVGGGSGSGF